MDQGSRSNDEIPGWSTDEMASTGRCETGCGRCGMFNASWDDQSGADRTHIRTANFDVRRRRNCVRREQDAVPSVSVCRSALSSLGLKCFECPPGCALQTRTGADVGSGSGPEESWTSCAGVSACVWTALEGVKKE